MLHLEKSSITAGNQGSIVVSALDALFKLPGWSYRQPAMRCYGVPV